MSRLTGSVMDYFARSSSFIDAGAIIGADTNIWPERSPIYGDGKSARRIVSILENKES